MLKFHTLKIAAIYPETNHATTVVFEMPEALHQEFAFKQGQHLNIRAEIDGQTVRRSYSLCNGPDEGIWRVTIKHVDDGVFSSYVQNLKAGDALEVMAPNGRFFTELQSDTAKQYVAFAAGSGITPVLSNLRAILAAEPDSRFCLFYGNRNLKTVLFNEELQDLKNRYLDRLSIHHVFSGEHREFDLYTGRLDTSKANELLDQFFSNTPVNEYLICGPGTMVRDLTAMLKERGVDPQAIHSERFGVARKKQSKAAAQTVDEAPKAMVSVTMDGHAREFGLQEGDTLLDAAIKAGLDLPFSCQAGVCSTCRAKLVKGQVTMDANHALEPWELEQGFILTCQSRPTTNTIELDYD